MLPLVPTPCPATPAGVWECSALGCAAKGSGGWEKLPDIAKLLDVSGYPVPSLFDSSGYPVPSLFDASGYLVPDLFDASGYLVPDLFDESWCLTAAGAG